MNMTITIKDNVKQKQKKIKLQVKKEYRKLIQQQKNMLIFGNFISFVIKIIFLWGFSYELLSFILDIIKA